MIISTTDNIHGKEISESLGLVIGSSVKTRAIGRDITAFLKTIMGGEVREYTQLQKQARDKATERMIAEAKNMGGDAIVGLRYVTSDILQGVSEILAYGTAVKYASSEEEETTSA